MSILETLFNGEYSAAEPKDYLPPALRKQECAFWEKIEETMGREFLEENWDCLSQVEYIASVTRFREGFRLGAQLMLELGGL